MLFSPATVVIHFQDMRWVAVFRWVPNSKKRRMGNLPQGINETEKLIPLLLPGLLRRPCRKLEMIYVFFPLSLICWWPFNRDGVLQIAKCHRCWFSAIINIAGRLRLAEKVFGLPILDATPFNCHWNQRILNFWGMNQHSACSLWLPSVENNLHMAKRITVQLRKERTGTVR